MSDTATLEAPAAEATATAAPEQTSEDAAMDSALDAAFDKYGLDDTGEPAVATDQADTQDTQTQDDAPQEAPKAYDLPDSDIQAFHRLQIEPAVAKALVASIAEKGGPDAASKFVAAIQSRVVFTDRLLAENKALKAQIDGQGQTPPAKSEPTQDAAANTAAEFSELDDLIGTDATKTLVDKIRQTVLKEVEREYGPVKQQHTAATARQEAEMARREAEDTKAGFDEVAKEIPSIATDDAKRQAVMGMAAAMFKAYAQQLGPAFSLDEHNLRSLIPAAARALYPTDFAQAEKVRLAKRGRDAVMKSPDANVRPSASRPKLTEDEQLEELAGQALAKYGITD